MYIYECISMYVCVYLHHSYRAKPKNKLEISLWINIFISQYHFILLVSNDNY